MTVIQDIRSAYQAFKYSVIETRLFRDDVNSYLRSPLLMTVLTTLAVVWAGYLGGAVSYSYAVAISIVIPVTGGILVPLAAVVSWYGALFVFTRYGDWDVMAELIADVNDAYAMEVDD